jgi:hypothetical protein
VDYLNVIVVVVVNLVTILMNIGCLNVLNAKKKLGCAEDVLSSKTKTWIIAEKKVYIQQHPIVMTASNPANLAMKKLIHILFYY